MTTRCLKWNFIETDLSSLISEERWSYMEDNSSFNEGCRQTSEEGVSSSDEIYEKSLSYRLKIKHHFFKH